MAWDRFVIGDTEYDLTHLRPFTLNVTPKSEGAPTFKVLVAFGHHTFTRDLRAGDPEELRFDHRGDVRCFCTERYGFSTNLPRIVTAASSGRAYFSQSRNYLLVEDLPGLAGPYAVFFNIERSRLTGVHANMFVVSAYPKPRLPAKNRLPAITFAALVSKTAAGEPIRRPRR
ncbi:MAG: hypothetical protein ACM3W4_12545 [Ignavibacteriales bacterium]